MNEAALIIIVFYVFLGLIAFIVPRFVHEVKRVLDLLDKLSTILLIFFILIKALQLKTGEVVEIVNSFVIDSLIGAIALFAYLFCANISRCFWLGRCSVNRIIGYLTTIIMHMLIIAVIRATLP